MNFRGVGTALITPFTPSGSLDYEALARFVDWQIEEGINFLVPCGTTGENPALTTDEQRRVVEVCVQRANGKVPVLAGAGSNSTERAIELALIAIDLGADGVLTITPYYNKPTPDGLRRHFATQAAAIEKRSAGFPMIMYNVPGRTGVNMTAATTLQIAAEVPNVVGVKEASANMEQILTILRERREGFAVLSGDDAWTLPLIAAGADGLVSVASNEVPRLMREMCDAALSGDFGTARAINNRLLPLLTGNFIESNPIPVKAALKMMGVLENDTVRSPLAPITDANREKLRAILKAVGI
jgi:4-hydroxy-tetrahydrodipicolinate synthase